MNSRVSFKQFERLIVLFKGVGRSCLLRLSTFVLDESRFGFSLARYRTYLGPHKPPKLIRLGDEPTSSPWGSLQDPDPSERLYTLSR
jgi:hypothetical protein